MITVKHLNRLGILLALVLIFWGISPFITKTPLTDDILASSIILILVGIGYIISVLKRQWNKAILFLKESLSQLLDVYCLQPLTIFSLLQLELFLL